MMNSAKIAYNMRRKSQDENPKLNAAHSKSAEDHAASIAHAILASKKGYADGGTVSEDAADAGDDFLSSDAHSEAESAEELAPLDEAHMPEDPEREVDGMGLERKKRLSDILAKVRYGK